MALLIVISKHAYMSATKDDGKYHLAKSLVTGQFYELFGIVFAAIHSIYVVYILTTYFDYGKYMQCSMFTHKRLIGLHLSNLTTIVRLAAMEK